MRGDWYWLQLPFKRNIVQQRKKIADLLVGIIGNKRVSGRDLHHAVVIELKGLKPRARVFLKSGLALQAPLQPHRRHTIHS